MSLNISLQNARIGTDITPGSLKVQTVGAQISLKQNNIKADIQTEHPKVKIDQYPSFATSGLKNYRDLTRQNAQEASRNVLEYISKTALDGDLMAKIESGIDAIAHIAKRVFLEQKEFNIETMPKQGPNIDVEGYVNINWEKSGEVVSNGVEIESYLGDLKTTYTKGNVDVYLVQKDFIEIEYNRENKVDIRI